MYIDDNIIIFLGIVIFIYIIININKKNETYIPEYNRKALLTTNYSSAFLPPPYSINTRTLNDPLYPPYNSPDVPQLPQIATKGCPSQFKKYGYLKAKDADDKFKYKFLILMGRRSCISSSLFDYYAIADNTESYMKFDILETSNELLTGDEIFIHALDHKYIVHKDRLDTYVYCP